MRQKIWILALTGLFKLSSAWGQTTALDFKKAFAPGYTAACQYLQSHELLIAQTLTRYGGEVRLLVSVVFPEMVRYSEVRNAIETASLEWLYVQYGPAYANFSIGHFQMKPTFAEEIENQVRQHQLLLFQDLLPEANAPEAEIRQARIQSLKSLAGQLKYLAAFQKLLGLRFPEWTKQGALERVRWAAAAYNRGFTASAAEISAWRQKSAFPYGPAHRGPQYNYTEIAGFFWEMSTSKSLRSIRGSRGYSALHG
ncbi:MAG: hypothetical protein HC913_00975 [Microscillaceae bacterium]|nr:hypothetical protein [Microscillaceae bacterium]